MGTFTDYLATIEDQKIHDRIEEILTWVTGKFPELGTRIGWSHPRFTDHGTFIFAFSDFKKH